ncbi:hypothetical protein MKW98_018858, partial [Papaver atlanticum]
MGDDTRKTKLRKKKKVTARLSTIILKSILEKAPMQAMIQLTENKQRRIKEKITIMDFDL